MSRSKYGLDLRVVCNHEENGCVYRRSECPLHGTDGKRDVHLHFEGPTALLDYVAACRQNGVLAVLDDDDRRELAHLAAGIKPGVRKWAPSSVTESTSHMGGDCRVCGKRVESTETALIKPWADALGRAHVACGFWRHGELEARKACPKKWGKYTCDNPHCDCVSKVA